MSSQKRTSSLLGVGSGSSNKRAKSPVPASADTQTRELPPNAKPSTPGYAMLSSLKLSMKVLRKGCHVFKPLDSAVGAMLEVLDSIEGIEEGNRGLSDLVSDLPEWSMVLSKYLSSSQPDEMSKCVEKLARSLVEQTEVIRSRQQQGKMWRLADSEQEFEELERCYRRIETSFRQLQTDTALSTWKTADDILKDSRLNALSPAHDARYDSSFSDEIKRIGCFENTRVAVLEGIRRWIRGADSVEIYWVNGMAGTGKTTIAYTVCAELKRHGRLGGSFFCSRMSPKCRSVSSILPTIAYQLAKQFYPFRSSLCRILGEESDMGQRNISAQFEYLIQTPLLEVKDLLPSGLVVVIDALDECSDPTTMETMLEMLFRSAAYLPVRFFLTSRPEPAITNTILARESRSRSVLHLHSVEEQFVKADIEIYLTVSLAKLSLNSDQIKQLADQAGILFIYAATAARYLLAVGRGTKRSGRLEAVLARTAASSNKRDREIDSLYKTVLDGALGGEDLEEDEIDFTKHVLWTVVCARESVTISTLSALLNADVEGVSISLQPLRSVLHVSGDSETVSTLHASFPEFILNPARSGPLLHCNETTHHGYLAKRCFELMEQQLKFNICNLQTSYRFDKDILDLENRVKPNISPALFYACRYWVDHLCFLSPEDGILDCLDSFLRNRLLFWIEVLNLTGWIRNGPKALGDVCNWLQKGDDTSILPKLAHDARNFVTTFAANPVHASTPHIYISVLPLVPRQSEVWKGYSTRIKGLLQFNGALMTQRDGAALTTWEAKWGITAIAYSPNGTRVVSGLSNHTLCIWDGHSATLIGRPLVGHTGKITSLSFSPDGTRIVSGSLDCTVRLWDAFNCTPVGIPIVGHTDGVTSITFSPNGFHVVSGSADRTIRTWDTHLYLPVGSPLEGHTSSVLLVAFSSDGARIISTSCDGTVRTWDAQNSPKGEHATNEHLCGGLCIAISLDGNLIAHLSYGFTIQVWNLVSHRSSQISKPFEGHTNDVLCASFSSDGTRIVSGSKDCTVRLWEVHEQQALGLPFNGHTSAVSSVAFSPDGARVISGSLDGTIRVWDVQGVALLDSTFGGHAGALTAVGFSPDGTRIVGSSGFMILTWDADTGVWLNYLFGGSEDETNFSSVGFSPNGAYIAGSSQQTVSTWDAHSCALLENQFEWYNDAILCISFSPNSKHIVSGSKDCSIQVWDICTGSLIGAPFQGHTGPVHSVSFSPDGTRIASGSEDRSVRMWDTCGGIQVGNSLKGHLAGVRAVAYSPDGSYIVSASADCTVRIWGTHSGRLLRTLQGHTNWVVSVAYSPNGHQIVSGSHDRTVRVWDAHSGNLVGSPLEGHTDWVVSVAFSPDGGRIVSGSHDRTVRVWEYFDKLPNTPRPTSIQKLILDKQGWVLDSDSGKVVFWCPPELRDIFPKLPNVLTISPEGPLKLSLAGVSLGEAWRECYVPLITEM